MLLSLRDCVAFALIATLPLTARSVGTVPTAVAGSDRPVVVATMSIWADIVEQIDCADMFEIDTLIPAGGDPHSYEPSMRDRETLDGAALVVANGAGLEAALADTLHAVEDDGTPVFAVADHVATQPIGPDVGDHDDHDGDDPHVWLDPTLVVEALPALADALVAAGADQTTMKSCVDSLTDELGALDEDVAGILDSVPADRRILVTNHDALGYFARHYDFEILGSVLPSSSTLVEASPSEIEDLANAIRDEGVTAIFAEALETTDDADALGDRLGVSVVTLYTDSLGDAGSDVTSYQALMRYDANVIADALAG
jgi:zinc/manganese transport system substrate-binding protein